VEQVVQFIWVNTPTIRSTVEHTVDTWRKRAVLPPRMLASVRACFSMPPPHDSTNLDHRALREFNQQAVDALFSATSITKAKFMDLQFAKNRRKGMVRTRQWYLCVDAWMDATTLDVQAPAAIASACEVGPCCQD
jgi:hypothetical protein